MALEKLLELKNLYTHFHTDTGIVRAVDGVSFEIYKGETLGLVGESGCGKSVTSLSIMGLVPHPGKVSGEIYFKGKNLVGLSEEEMNKYRGNKIAMIFQEPMTALNPVFKIGDQVSEPLIYHKKMDKKSAWKKAIELLELTQIPDPDIVVNRYPFQLSGGMKQRAFIAMSLACDPDLLIADEPTTALDVTVQKQILKLMNDLKEEVNAAVLLITHDLRVVAEVADRVAVMYAGKIVEYGDKIPIFENPKHPYTRGLLNALPQDGKEELKTIRGEVPNLKYLPTGCSFHPRCDYCLEKCTKEMPDLKGEEYKVRCWNQLENDT